MNQFFIHMGHRKCAQYITVCESLLCRNDLKLKIETKI